MPESSFSAPDLTKQPPRSARVRLGGFALLPRMLDKCRATIAGTNGGYHFACPLDQRILEFIGVEAEALKAEVAKGLGDGEILQWINQNGKVRRHRYEIAAWTAYEESRPATDVEARGYFQELQQEAGPQRNDIGTWAELLDLDDYVSFGGKA